MKSIVSSTVLLFCVLSFTSLAKADLECDASKGKFSMVLRCLDGRLGSVDKVLPTDEIIKMQYRIDLKNGESKNVEVTGAELKTLIKKDRYRHDVYPAKDKIALFLNKKLQTNLNYKDISNVTPVKAFVSPSIKLYDGLVENGKTYIAKDGPGTGSVSVDAVPVKPRRYNLSVSKQKQNARARQCNSCQL